MDDPFDAASVIEPMREALSDGGNEHADVYVRRLRRGFARYSLNTLSQHAETSEDSVTVRVGMPEKDGFRLASVTTTELSRAGIRAALDTAATIAKRAEVIPAWPGFGDDTTPTPDVPRFAEATATCTASMRAGALRGALDESRSHGLTAAGSLETSQYVVAVCNTRGVRRHALGTISGFRMFALDADGNSGFAQSLHRDVQRLDVAGRAREACRKSLAGKDPVILPAGEYDVILEPSAVTELLEWLSFTAFGARDVADGTSPLAGRAGERITGEAVTLVDNALDATDVGFGMPFDRDGVARRRVVLVEKGLAREPVYDRLYGARLGHASTGHAGPPGGFEDAPVAQAVQFAAGSDTREGLLARVKRGLLITRFHYVNGFLEPRRALMTGLTRDGTFLVEDGKVTRGVRNMRFTDSVLEAFARIEGVTAVREAVPTWWSEAGAFVAPTILIRGFRFNGGGVERPKL